MLISLHFGWEYQLYPSPRDIDLCREFIDAGADIILGHHPHYPQGIERYGNGIIAYSLGNFIWDQNFVGHTASSYALEIELTKSRIISVRILPSRMNRNYRLEHVTDSESIDEINSLSAALKRRQRMNELWYFIPRNKMLEFIKIFTNVLKERRVRKKKSHNLLLYVTSRPLKNCKDSRFYDFGIFSKKL